MIRQKLSAASWLPLGGKLSTTLTDEGRTLFSHSRYYSNKKVFPLSAENCQPLRGFPLGGSSLRSEVMRGSRFSTKQGDEEKPAFLFCLKNCLNKIFRTKGRSLFSHSRYYSNKKGFLQGSRNQYTGIYFKISSQTPRKFFLISRLLYRKTLIPKSVKYFVRSLS